MGVPDDLDVAPTSIPQEQDAMSRPRRERARSSSLGALATLEEPTHQLQSAVALQEGVVQPSGARDGEGGSASSSVGLGLLGVEAEQRGIQHDGLSPLASSESSSPASTSALATPLYYTPPIDPDDYIDRVDSTFAPPRTPSERSPALAAPIPPSATVPVSPTPTLHITNNPFAPPLNPIPISAPSLTPSQDKRGSLSLEERLSNLELSPPRLDLVGEETSEETAGASLRGVLPLPRVSESSSSSAELKKELDEKAQQGRERRKAEQAIAHVRLNDALGEETGGSGTSTTSSLNAPSPAINPPTRSSPSLRSSSSLGYSPSNPLPSRPERSTLCASPNKSLHPSSQSLPTPSGPPRLTHSASSPSLLPPITNLSPSKVTSKADKRSSILSFVGFGSLGRKKGSALAPPPVASPPRMTRSPSAQSYEFASSGSTLDGVREMEDDEYFKEEGDDFVAVDALQSGSPAAANEVRVINSKAAALLGLQATGEGSPTSPPRSLPMSPSTSQDSPRSHRSKLQRAGSSKDEKDRKGASSGSEAATVHTYEHDPLPPFPSTLGGVLEHELTSDALYRHAPPEHHHTFLRSHHRPSSKDWRPQQLYLTSFPSPLSEPPTSILSLHLFKTPAARNDREVARLELTRESIVCVPEDESPLALGGSSKVSYALKITGVAPREMDERGRPVEGERKRTSWIVGMEKVEQMKRWMKVLKDAVQDMQDASSSGSPLSAGVMRSPSVETGLTERQGRERQPSWQSTASAQSSTASVASSLFFDSGPRMDRRPSESSPAPSTNYSLSPPPLATRSPGSRKNSSAGLSFDDPSHDPLPSPAPQLYIDAQLPSPPSALADDSEEVDDPGTAHPYRMALPHPHPRPSSRDFHTKRLSVLSSPPRARPSEDSTSTSNTTSSDPPRHPNRDSTSLSSISSRTTSSSHKHPPRPPAPTFGLPPLPGPPRDLPLPLPRTASDPTSSRAQKRLSVMSTSTSASSNSSCSLRSRLSGAPLPPQLPPPPSASLPLPPPPAGEAPYKGLHLPSRTQRASPASISEGAEVGGDSSEARGDARARSTGSKSAPPDFAMGALPPPPPLPPPQLAMGPLPAPPAATAPRATQAGGSVKGLVKRWEGK